MKKFLTTAFLAVFGAFILSSAKAEISLSGYQEFYMGSADQSTQNAIATTQVLAPIQTLTVFQMVDLHV